MCGISGIIGPKANSTSIQKMVDIQHHRGPDDKGLYVNVERSVALGHNRLSIIDTSSAGHEPMVSACGRYHLVFNGEIYNYKEIRAKLNDYPYHSQTDTEVILAAYSKWGMDCLKHFIGMFAFCIFDLEKNTSFLARDRFGIKPLQYAVQDKTFYFSSEIKALLAVGINANPNWGIWGDYLKLGLYDHCEETFFANIQNVAPGTYIEISNTGEFSIHRYWTLPTNAPVFTDNEAALKEQFHDLLKESVNLHLRSDVPFGVNLSGGTDSSALCLLMDEVSEPDQILTTYTMAFGDERYDEIVHAGAVPKSRKWNSRHVLFHASEVPDYLEKSIWHQESPVGGVATLAYQKLHQVAKQDGTTVLLEGQGMDEILAGYGYYESLIENQKTYTASSDGTPLFYQDNSKFLAPEMILAESPISLSGRTDFEEPFGDILHNAMMADLFHRRVPRVLRMNDRLSMAYGVELREPFLNHKLVEFCFRLPLNLKFNDGNGKFLLREILFDGNPECRNLWEHKRAVTTPQREWLQEDLKDYVWDIISSQDFLSLGLFDTTMVKNAFTQYVKEGGDNSFYIWQWLNVYFWFKHFIKNGA